MRTPEAKKLIGKKVEWEDAPDDVPEIQQRAAPRKGFVSTSLLK